MAPNDEESLSPEEMDNLTSEVPEASPEVSVDLAESADGLTPEERAAFLEMGTLAMNAAATALAGMLNKEVQLGGPDFNEHAGIGEIAEPFAGEEKYIALTQYSQAYQGAGLLILRSDEARVIANLTLGQVEEDASTPFSEMQINGLTEALNLMMNGSAAQLSSAIAQPVEIDALTLNPYTADSLLLLLPTLATGPVVEMVYPLLIGEESAPLNIIQFMTASDAKALARYQLDASTTLEAEPSLVGVGVRLPDDGEATQREANPVTVQPIQFTPLDNQPSMFGEQHKNLELVMDVALSLTVELGKTEISIKEVLELTRGSVIELDRVAGEPVDLLANGKLIAKGEVVVIEDNFGLRITSIVSPADRLRGL